MPFNIPIVLTWSRILLIPLLVGIYYFPSTWFDPQEKNVFATIVFVIAAVTDWLDGYLARKLKQTSAFGAFLDPVADKLMVAVALILLVELDRSGGLVASIIIGREIAISALREWMAQIGKSASVAVSMVGKIKTVAQMVAIPMMLYEKPILGFSMLELGSWLLYLAALLTLWSMGYYIERAWSQLKGLNL
jgi:CDP-diacylglycerol--glycerol-3-phosphate 3-phosphatidyltransferase/cardiolipin synthase